MRCNQCNSVIEHYHNDGAWEIIGEDDQWVHASRCPTCGAYREDAGTNCLNCGEIDL